MDSPGVLPPAPSAPPHGSGLFGSGQGGFGVSHQDLASLDLTVSPSLETTAFDRSGSSLVAEPQGMFPKLEKNHAQHLTLADFRAELHNALGRDLLLQLRTMIREELHEFQLWPQHRGATSSVLSSELEEAEIDGKGAPPYHITTSHLRPVRLSLTSLCDPPKMDSDLVSQEESEAESSADDDDFGRVISVAGGALQEAGMRMNSSESPRTSMASIKKEDDKEAAKSPEDIAADNVAADPAEMETQRTFKQRVSRSVRFGKWQAIARSNSNIQVCHSLTAIDSLSTIRTSIKNGVVAWTPRRLVKRCVHSVLFDTLMLLIVMTNAATIGIAVNLVARAAYESGRMELPGIFEKFETFFCVVFTTELCLRFYIFEPDCSIDRVRLSDFEKRWFPKRCLFFLQRLRLTFFWSMANLFDVVLVGLQLLDEVSKGFGYEAEQQTSIADAMVYLRLFRIFRLLRIVRFLEQLSSLLYLVFASLWAFIWTLLLLVVLTYMTGTFFTHVVAEHIILHPEDGVRLRPSFGSLGASAYTLYEAIMGGVDWHEVADPLWNVSTAMPLCFGVYIAFCVLVLLNLVTGVFVDTAQQMRQDDRKKELNRGLSSAADMAGITMNEDVPDLMFREVLKKPGMRSFLKMHDVDKATVRKVFGLLRERNNGTLSLNDFVTFCLRLNGLGNAIELAGLHLTGAKDRMQLMHLHQRGERDRAYLRKLTEHSTEDHADLKRLHLQGVAERRQLHEMLMLIQLRLGSGKESSARIAGKFEPAALPEIPAPGGRPAQFSPRTPRLGPQVVLEEVVVQPESVFEVEETPMALQTQRGCSDCRPSGALYSSVL